MAAFTQNANPTQGYESQVPPSQPGSQAGPTTYTIGGVRVDFPAKAYPSQVAMMSKVIQGLKQRQNCLLESPTGSGKTLALLCSALAWQRHEAERVERYNAEIDSRAYNQALRRQKLEHEKAELVRKATEESIKLEQEKIAEQIRKAAEGVVNLDQGMANNKTDPEMMPPKQEEGAEDCNNVPTIDLTDESMEFYDSAVSESLFTSDDSFVKTEPETTTPKIMEYSVTDDEDDDFQPHKRTRKSEAVTPKKEKHGNYKAEPLSDRETKIIPELTNYGGEGFSFGSTVDEPLVNEKKLTVPKIYFGTRTHKQISQITRELRKTSYRNARTVILASREHTCINVAVQKLPNKNEACRELMDATTGGGCPWYANVKKIGNFYELRRAGLPISYDLEDLIEVGKKNRACPYYVTRSLMDSADVIICPYNYLIDPVIRNSMSIDVDNQVVIFDEAHNMEDASRESSSFLVVLEDIRDAMQDFEKVANIPGVFEPYAHESVAKFLSGMAGWIGEQENNLTSLSFESSGKCWTGTEAVAQFDVAGMSEHRVKTVAEYFALIVRNREEELGKQKERGGRMGGKTHPTVTALTIKTVEAVFRLFGSLTAKSGIHMNDYRVALMKQTIRGRRDRGGGGGSSSKEALSLHLWCLNPAIAFSDFKEVHSIVLTSGTLSPITSFQSELGTPFPIKLEASHVIDRNQVLVGMIGVGPENIVLNGSFRTVETFSYQDELGRLIHQVCSEMPYGVLCFFPSYRLLEKVVERWQNTGMWKELKMVKRVLIEPRTGVNDFEDAIQAFYDANSDPDPIGNITGGLFLAVCRGKVSEGIDFADNNARAVICIGIPFPAFKDMQVEMKREYNQQNMSRGLLSGGDWYEIQAFRALNQALGRCIRHRHDWGAILLVDDRFIQTPRYTNSLSKWVRSSAHGYSSWGSFLQNLHKFKEDMMAKPIQAAAFQPVCSALEDNSSSNTQNSNPFSSAGLDVSDNDPFQSKFFGFTPGPKVLTPSKNTNPASGGGSTPTQFNSPQTPLPITSYLKMNNKRKKGGTGSNW